MKYKSLMFLLILMTSVVVISCQGGKDPNIAYYTCSMHPQIKMDNPGQCPICGMDLVPVKNDSSQKGDGHAEHDDEDQPNAKQIKINPRYVQNIGIQTQAIQKRQLTRFLSTHGKVAHDQKLWVAQNEYLEALKLGDKELIQTAEQKLLFLGISQSWIDNLKKTRSADLSLHLQTGHKSIQFVEAYVYQNDVSVVKEGMKAEIQDQNGQLISMGTIKSLSTLLDLQTRTLRALIQTDENKELKLNTFVQVKIEIPLGEKLSVPKKAILFNGNENLVYLTKGAGVFEAKAIQIGQQAQDFYEVQDGLEEGDIVVTNGHFLIDSESQIRSATTTEPNCPEGEKWDASMKMCMPALKEK